MLKAKMMRIDLFTTGGCPSCPRARAAVSAFAASRRDVEVREWDLARDPGPASGRGIFAAPAILVDGRHVLIGIPRADDLHRLALPATDEHRQVLVLGCREEPCLPALLAALERAEYRVVEVEGVGDALDQAGKDRFAGAVVGARPEWQAGGRMQFRGLRAWHHFLGRADPEWGAHPLVVHVPSGAPAAAAEESLRRRRILNPCLIVTELDAGDQASLAGRLAGHLRVAE